MKQVRDATASILDETTFADLLDKQAMLSQNVAGFDFNI